LVGCPGCLTIVYGGFLHIPNGAAFLASKVSSNKNDAFQRISFHSKSRTNTDTKTMSYLDVSLNGGTPKTPQNDHF